MPIFTGSKDNLKQNKTKHSLASIKCTVKQTAEMGEAGTNACGPSFSAQIRFLFAQLFPVTLPLERENEYEWYFCASYSHARAYAEFSRIWNKWQQGWWDCLRLDDKLVAVLWTRSHFSLASCVISVMPLASAGLYSSVCFLFTSLVCQSLEGRDHVVCTLSLVGQMKCPEGGGGIRQSPTSAETAGLGSLSGLELSSVN